MARWNTDKRDLRQRIFGCLGFSLFAHAGAMTALVVSAQMQNEPFGLPEGNGGETVYMDLQTPGATESPIEVVSLDQPPVALSQDADAVILPATAPKEKKVAPQPNAKAVVTKAASKEPVKETPKEETITDDQSDIDVKAALAAAREEEQSQPQAEALLAETPVLTASEEEFMPPAPSEEEPLAAASVIEESPAETLPTELPPAQKPVATPSPEVVAAVVVSPAAASPDAQQAATTTAAAPAMAGQQTGELAPQGAPRPGGFGTPTGNQVREASELVARPGNRPPVYPQQDRLHGREGMVVLIGRVLPDGSMAEIAIEKRSGSPLMDQAALDAYKNWKFMPGQEGLVRNAFKFALEGEAQTRPALLRRRR